MKETIAWTDLPRVRCFDLRDVEPWQDLPWEARALYPLLRTLMAPLGKLPLDEHDPTTVVAAQLRMPMDFVRRALECLEAASWIRIDDDAIVDPDFEAQERAPQSPALRQRQMRARRAGRHTVRSQRPIYLVVHASDDTVHWALRGGDSSSTKGDAASTACDVEITADRDPVITERDPATTRAGDANRTDRDASVTRDAAMTPRDASITRGGHPSGTDRTEPHTARRPDVTHRNVHEPPCDADVTLGHDRATRRRPTRAPTRASARASVSSLTLSLPLFEDEDRREEKTRHARGRAREAEGTQPRRITKKRRRAQLQPIFEQHMARYRDVLPACDRQQRTTETDWRTWDAAMRRSGDDADQVLAQMLGHRWDTWEKRPQFNSLQHVLKESNARFADWELQPECRPRGADSKPIYEIAGDRQTIAKIEQARADLRYVTDSIGRPSNRPPGEEIPF